MKRSAWLVTHLAQATLCLLLLVCATTAMAAPHFPHHEVLDDRYHHGHFYPPRGLIVHELPVGYRPYLFHGARYYFVGGIWYAPAPGGFVVVRPPVGLIVNVLPPFYTTVWFDGVPYYYADDVYYRWVPGEDGYEVVDPPSGADQPSAAPVVSSDDLMIYPKNGQSSSQQAADRYECHNWAKSQTHFDPTVPGGGVPASELAASRDQYRRAMIACLEGRGYSVQ